MLCACPHTDVYIRTQEKYYYEFSMLMIMVTMFINNNNNIQMSLNQVC